MDRDPFSPDTPDSGETPPQPEGAPPIEYMDDDAPGGTDSAPDLDAAPDTGIPAPPPTPMSDQSISIDATNMPVSMSARNDDHLPPLGDPSGAPDDNLTESTEAGAGSTVDPATDGSDEPAPEPVAEQKKPAAKFGLRIPNGTTGKSYKADLPIQIADPPTSLIDAGLEFDGLQELGVEYEVLDNHVRFFGTPNQDGEHSIHVRFRHPNSGTREYSISFLVNPDPRSLWKNLEPAPDSPFAKPHSDSDRKDGVATMIAASLRGRSHAHSGTFRDDDFSLAFVDDWCILAVADGAGSAKYSRQGAKVACDVVLDRTTQHLRGSLDGDFKDLLSQYARKDGDADEARRQIGQRLYSSLGDAAMAAYRAVQQESDATEGSQLKDFSTTLLFAICRQFDFGWFVGTFGIGDGGIGVYRADDEIIILNRPDGGDFAGQTRFLTMSEIWKSPNEIAQRLGFCIVDSFTALCLMTDGVSDPKFQTDNNFFDTSVWHEFWSDLSSEVRLERDNTVAHAELLDWLDFWSKGNHDDRTIAILLP
jgi:hypothetical protein